MASRFSDSDVLYTFALCADIPEDAWRTRLGWTTAFQGDKARSFINLYTADQMADACQSLFAGKQDAMLLQFIVDSMREEADLEIKFEAAEFEAGGVGAHAHCYGGYIPYACLPAPPASRPARPPTCPLACQPAARTPVSRPLVRPPVASPRAALGVSEYVL